MGKGNRLRRRAQKQEKDTTTYWHGGRAGRAVDDELLPGTVVLKRWGYPLYQPDISFEDYRPDFVYATTDRDLALDFAILTRANEAAALYRVELNKGVEHDPDFPVGISFRCLSATVVAVELDEIDRDMSMTHASHHYQEWDDGTPLYNENGYAQPNKAAQHFGVTTGDLFSLGKYPDFPLINARCNQIAFAHHPTITQEEVLAVRRMTGGKV